MRQLFDNEDILLDEIQQKEVLPNIPKTRARSILVVDSVMMRISDVCLAFPGLVFAMAVAAILDGGVRNAVIALALISWPKYSRIARGQTLSVKNSALYAGFPDGGRFSFHK